MDEYNTWNKLCVVGKGVEVLNDSQKDGDDFSSKYRVKDNTRRDKYPYIEIHGGT